MIAPFKRLSARIVLLNVGRYTGRVGRVQRDRRLLSAYLPPLRLSAQQFPARTALIALVHASFTAIDRTVAPALRVKHGRRRRQRL